MANTHSLDLETSSSQYASISDASQTGLDFSSALTFEMWVKLESSTATNTLIGKSNSGTNQIAYQVYITSDNKLNFFTSSDGSTSTRNIYTSTSATVPDGVYTHIAVTFDASTEVCNMYINGLSVAVSQTGTAFSGTIFNSTESFTLGSESFSTSNSLDGLIDEVRAWDDVRTAQEIQDNLGKELVGNEANLQGYWKLNNNYTDSTSNGNDLTASGSPVFSTEVPFDGSETSIDDSTTLKTNLVSYWTLDENSGTRADSHGSNDLTDNNTVLSGTGILSNGADFEAGNSESLSITDGSQTGLDITGDLTASAWINLESSPANNTTYTILQKGTFTTDTGSTKSYGFIYQDIGGTEYLKLQINDIGTGTSTNATHTVTLTPGTFYHVAVSYDASAGTCTFYIDGIAVGTGSSLDTSIHDGGGEFAIGADKQANGFYFDGIIDEVGIWSRILTAGEISNLYNEGNALPYAPISFSVSDTVTLTENITNLRTRNFSVSETTTLTESVTFALGKIVEIAETVSLSETLTTARTYITNIVESVTLTEIKAQVFKLWNNKTRNTSSWTDKTRNTSSWNNKSRS